MQISTTALEALWFGEDDSAAIERKAAESAANALATSIGLKPFPKAARQAMDLLDQPEINLTAIRETFRTDPGLTGRVLKLANSGYFHSATPCTTIRDAIVRLGTDNLRDLVSAAAVHGMFKDLGGAGDALLKHAVSVGSIARAIGQRIGVEEVGQLYLAGLMHDVGKLLLLQAGTTQVGTALDEGIAVERDQLGFDHAVLGALALEAWEFPEHLSRVVALHHQPARAFEEGASVARLVAVLRLADEMDHELAWGSADDDDVITRLARSANATWLGLDAGTIAILWAEAQRARFDASLN